MNYIGSKQTLLPFIDEVLTVTIGDRIQSFTDGFAGTGIVSRNIQKNKPYTWIHANDIQTYSEYVTFARLHPYFYNYDLKLIKELNNLDGVEGFIYKTYASDGAMYFTPKNEMVLLLSMNIDFLLDFLLRMSIRLLIPHLSMVHS